MESPSSWPERTNLPITRNLAIQELTDGEVWRDKLSDMLSHPETDPESAHRVTVQVLRVLGNALTILNSSNLNQIPGTPVTRSHDTRSTGSWDDRKSIDFGVRTPVKPKRGRYTRDVTREEIYDTLTGDGFAWRKYGQKKILNSNHEKSYFRCTHQEQGCKATKQVQMTDEEVPRYKITYQGHHTCDTKSQGAYPNILEASSPTARSFSIDVITNKGTTRINDKAETGFKSMKHTPNEGHYPSLGRRPTYNHQISSDHRVFWDPSFGLSQVSSEPMVMMPYDDVFPATSRGIHGHEMDGGMIGSFGTFPI